MQAYIVAVFTMLLMWNSSFDALIAPRIGQQAGRVLRWRAAFLLLGYVLAAALTIKVLPHSAVIAGTAAGQLQELTGLSLGLNLLLLIMLLQRARRLALKPFPP